MFEFCLLSLTWQIDPVSVDTSTRYGTNTISTCVRPIIKTVEPDAGHAKFLKPGDETAEILLWLKKWEASTAGQPAWSRSRLEEFQQSIQQEFNKHTAVAAEQLIGQVNSDRLKDTFQWGIAERTDGSVVLEAFPYDETDRLFYRSFRISLSVNTAAPDKIVVIGRNQLQRIVWQSGQRPNSNRIQLVNYEEEVPPAPIRVLRKAESRVD